MRCNYKRIVRATVKVTPDNGGSKARKTQLINILINRITAQK